MSLKSTSLLLTIIASILTIIISLFSISESTTKEIFKSHLSLQLQDIEPDTSDTSLKVPVYKCVFSILNDGMTHLSSYGKKPDFDSTGIYFISIHDSVRFISINPTNQNCSGTFLFSVRIDTINKHQACRINDFKLWKKNQKICFEVNIATNDSALIQSKLFTPNNQIGEKGEFELFYAKQNRANNFSYLKNLALLFKFSSK